MRCFDFAALIGVLSAVVVLGAPQADFVPALPGFNGTLPSRHYSGYLKGLGGSHLHYYAVEASEADPKTSPVVLWMNGGPGCSSMDGWGYELGPFHFKNFDEAGPTFVLNPYTWTKKANVFFLEAPPGVGFSYRDDGNYTISDSENARNNYAAVKYFFDEKFPEWKANKFFVAGESYGGIYVPTLAHQIFIHKELSNFAGILVGNGVTSAEYDDFYHGDLTFDYTHGLCSQDVYEQILLTCNQSSSTYNSTICNNANNDYNDQTYLLNFYGAYYKCFEKPNFRWLHIPSLRRRLEMEAKRMGTTVRALIDGGNTTIPPSPPGGDVPCIDSTAMGAYLNRADVKAALHVEPSLDWHICYYINYVEDVPSVVFVWKELIAAKIPVLFYSGNVDRAVPYTGTKAWIASGGWKKTTGTTMWAFNDARYTFGPQVGGLYEVYDNVFTFVMVNGAGHMVPQFRPAAAYVMFVNYMKSINATDISGFQSNEPSIFGQREW